MPYSFSRCPAVTARTGYSRSALYAHIKAGLFVPPISLGARTAAWLDSEVDAVLSARIAGKSDAEIRELVTRLVAARSQALIQQASS